MTQETTQKQSHESRDEEYRSYPEIVWDQFTDYKLSYYSLLGMGVLFVIALTAPVIAMNVPFYLYVPEGVGPSTVQGLSFPWFRALFDLNYFASGVDLFFNYLLFSIPLNLAAWFAYRPLVSDQEKRQYKQSRLKFIYVSLTVQVIGFIGILNAGFSQPYMNYTRLAEKEGVEAFFPFFEYAYQDTNIQETGLAPTWAHWLGTDAQGHDVLTRLIYGTRISLTIGIVAMGIATIIGTILGSLGGYFGGKVDMVVLRLIEVMLCFPALFIILTLRGFINDPSVFHIMAIIGMVSWTRIARLVRGEFLRLKNEDFVQAAQALGLNEGRVIFRHILPNALGPVLVAVTFGVASAILIEATISFLGAGPTNTPSWGQILINGDNNEQMVLVLAATFAIFITVSLMNLVGEGVRDAIDPKLRD
jgi:peptide/nickel transport system permease protein